MSMDNRQTVTVFGTAFAFITGQAIVQTLHPPYPDTLVGVIVVLGLLGSFLGYYYSPYPRGTSAMGLEGSLHRQQWGFTTDPESESDD